MNTTQFRKHLIALATQAGDLRAARIFLRENAPKLSKAEKIAADEAVVDALAAKYGVEATKSQRPLFSGWTFSPKGGDADYKAACLCANVALSEARKVLAGKAKPAEQVSRFEKAFATIKRGIEADDVEAIRFAKRVMALVQKHHITAK